VILSGLSLFNIRNSNETLSAVLAVELLQLQYSESVLNSGSILNNKYWLQVTAQDFADFLKKKSCFSVLIHTFPSTAPCLQGRLIE